LLQQLGEGYTSLLETCLSLMRSVFLQFLSIGDVRNKFVNY